MVSCIGASKTVTAKADDGWFFGSQDVIAVHSLHADYTVRADRKVDVVENICVEFLDDGLTMFYRSLPKEKARYTNVTAACESNEDFSYYVADNPDYSEFIDINCVGGAEKGNTWTYTLSYTVEHAGELKENGMIIDVVGFGWSVPLNDVRITVHFPENSKLSYDVYSGDYQSTSNQADVKTQQLDATTLLLTADRLERIYQSDYGQRMAEGITLSFSLGRGVLQDYQPAVFLEHSWSILLFCGIGLVLAALLWALLPKRRELITTVNVRAPEEMDPMAMGKWLDGVIDNEDVTSMLYYFADKGYLHIDFSDEDDPVLVQKVASLPAGEAIHARTLFDGLFKHADRQVIPGETPFDEDTIRVTTRVSKLKHRFYESVNVAKEQVAKPRIYEGKSIFFYLLGGIVGGLISIFASLTAARMRVGGGYSDASGIFLCVPILVLWVLGYVGENYRYKWKKSKRFWFTFGEIAITAFFALIFLGTFATHFMTTWEKLLLCVTVFVCAFSTLGKLNRKERYSERLGHILGFKDFIVYTEEDKIKAMLEENPELFYKVLPYAQVLGVTDEWEDKFKNITLTPPTWCYATDMTLLDYLLIRSCMRTAMVTAMLRPEPKGGSFVGRGGGGGSFGGFGGGGFGGGGGGAR